MTSEETRYVLVIQHDSGVSKVFGSLAQCHAELGLYAGGNELDLHVHAGAWTASCYSTAFKGDILLGAKAVVRKVNNNE
jgi:hypothetical protein